MHCYDNQLGPFRRAHHMERPPAGCFAAHQAAGSPSVVRVFLDDRTHLKACKRISNGDSILQHFLLSMESEPEGPLSREFLDSTLDQEGLRSSMTTTRGGAFSPERA